MNDTTGTGIFDFYTFQAILGKAGVFLPRQDISKIYRHYDVHREERVDYREFLRDLVGEIGTRRKVLIEKTFNDLDTSQTGELEVAELVKRFNPQGHPKVQDGTFTEKQVFTEFFDSFPGAAPGRSGKISKQEFVDYYSDLSSSIPHDDEAFARYLTGVWGVQEDPNASPLAAIEQKRTIRNIRNLIAAKIQQRSKTGGVETDTLRKCFKTYDLDDEGRLSAGPFFEALSTFGITFDRKTQQLYFDSLPKSEDGKVDYTVYSHSIFDVEESKTSNNFLAHKPSAPVASTASKSTFSVPTPVQGRTSNAVPQPSNVSSQSQPKPQEQLAEEEKEPTIVIPQDGEDDSFPAVLFLLGGPCSGKTEQSAKLVNNLGFAHINVRSAIFAHYSDASSKYHSVVRECLTSGQLIPVEIVVAIIRETMEERYQAGHLNFVIDGFPRSKRHLAAWNNIMGKYCRPPVFVLLDTPAEVLAKRAQQIGLPQEEFEKELAVFETEQLPLCEWLAVNNVLQVVSGEDSPSAVHSRILHIIQNA